MEWKKAQNYTIIFLIVINMLFLGLNIIKGGETRLSNKDITRVTQVLNQRGIALNCRLPKDYRPMVQLYMRGYEYDNIKLQEIFFGSISGVIRTQDDNTLIFGNDTGVLRVEGDRVIFRGGSRGQISTLEQAQELADSYVSQLNKLFGSYSLRLSLQREDSFYLEYGERFHSQQIFSNYLSCVVNGDGSFELEFNYQQPIDYKGTEESVISAGEAVYAVAQMLEKEDREGILTLDKVEKGYFLSERQRSGELAAVPYYKVYINEGQYACYVNGYSGDVTME